MDVDEEQVNPIYAVVPCGGDMCLFEHCCDLCAIEYADRFMRNNSYHDGHLARRWPSAKIIKAY